LKQIEKAAAFYQDMGWFSYPFPISGSSSPLHHPSQKKSYFPVALAPFVQVVTAFRAAFPPPLIKNV
jgi:hypothetical protein